MARLPILLFAAAIPVWLAACAGGPTVESSATLTDPAASGGNTPAAAEPAAKGSPGATAEGSTDQGSTPAKDSRAGRRSDAGGVQNSPPPPGTPQVEYDEVLAIVGPEVVTRRSIHDSVKIELRALLAERRAKNPDATLDADTIQSVERRIVQEQVRDFLLADHVNALGIDRARIDAFVEQQLRKTIRESEAEAGSSLELLERLRSRGLDYNQFVERERRRIRRQIAISEEFRKARANSPLLATPKEMQAFYEANLDRFKTPSSADVSILRFAVADGLASPQERALAARQELLAGKPILEIEKRHGGRLQELPKVLEDGAVAEVVKRFAFAEGARAGLVSAPVQVGSELWVLRLDARTEGGTRPFLDREVQDEIRRELMLKKRQELYFDIDRREQRRIQVWPRDLFRG